MPDDFSFTPTLSPTMPAGTESNLSNTCLDTPQFSVIIPVYNGERFIAETIQSVLAQTYKAVEIIVVDDGSSDDTATIVEQYSEQISICYVRQQNQGPSIARNHGVSLARGDWIAFLDADDVWYANKLQTHRDYIIKNPDVVLFWCDMDNIDEHGYARRDSKGRDPLAQIIFDRPVCPLPSSAVMRKNIFEQTTGFNPVLRCYEDVEYFFRLANAFPAMYMAEKLFAYRKYEKQPDYLRMRGLVDNWSVVNALLVMLCRDDPSKQTALSRQSASIYSGAGRHLLRAGNLEKARYCFRQSFAQRPFYGKNLRRWVLSYLPGLRTIYRHAKKHAVRC
jgi:glycosyltransferase involved in cell wall biosynthesis